MKSLKLIWFVVATLLLTVSSAFAFGEIRYTDRPLNLRAGRSPKAKWIGNMYAGQQVRVAHIRDGWAAIYEPDATDDSEAAAVGYSNIKYLKKKRTRHDPKPWGELVTPRRPVNVRKGPDTSYGKITTLRPGENYIVDFPDGDWIRVFPANVTIRSSHGGIGYSSAKYFKPAKVSRQQAAAHAEPAAPAVEKTPVPPTTDTVEIVSGQGEVSGAVAPEPAPESKEKPKETLKLVVLDGKVNVHRSRTSNSPLVRTLLPNQMIQVGLADNGWYGVFAANEMVPAESRVLGYALKGIVDRSSKPAERGAGGVPVAAQPRKAVQPVAVPSKTAPVVVQPTPAPAQTKAPVKKQQTVVIDRSAFTKKRPDPTPDKTAHGYKYRIVEKSETRQYGETWVTLKVFLATSKLPARDALEDFATTLWKENRRVTKNVAVLIYLPGMDTEELAYGVLKFDDQRLLEVWVRRATLFGTKFM